MDMNAVWRCVSAPVQCGTNSVTSTIDGTDHSDGHLRSTPVEEETTMLKTISAALLAASVLAAPALAASADKTTQTPVTKSTTDKAAPAKTMNKPVDKSTSVKPTDKTSAITPTTAKPSALNANAKMHKQHVKHARHYRHHKKVAAKANTNLSLKPATVAKPAIKRS
jgi:hypothetical protein